jgi:uncharacterized protein (TIGR02001 family)
MKTYLTLSAIALAAAATLSSGVASAEEAAAPVPDIAVTTNVGITSDYRFRGVSQNNQAPSFQGGVDVAFNKLGLYVGTWGSNVSQWTAGNGTLEMDLYGGYKTEVAGIAVDLGLIDYQYPGSGSYKANTQEAYLGLGYGIASFKVSRTIGNNYFATTTPDGKESAKGTMYYDLTLSQEVLPKLTASAHAGYTDNKTSGPVQFSNLSYEDYNVGLAYDYNSYVFGVKLYKNNLASGTKSWIAPGLTTNGKNLGNNGVALSLTRSF